MRSVEIYVPRKDLDLATKKSKQTGFNRTAHCPIAISLRRKFKRPCSVSNSWARVGSRFFKLGKRAKNLVRNFDNGTAKACMVSVTELSKEEIETRINWLEKIAFTL